MASSRSTEVRLWWPLPLAVLVWLAIIWGVGFLLSISESEVVTPPPIEAHFIELPEAVRDQEPSPAPRKSPATESQPRPEPRPEPTQAVPKPIQPAAPLPRHSPPVRPKISPNAIEKTEKAKTLPEKEHVPPASDAAAPVDLSDYINQARARRQAAGLFDGNENTQSAASNPQPSEDDLRMARIKRNLQMPGTSGIFSITSIGPRYAQFTFRAWTTGISSPRRQEVITVDAGVDGDVERAIIRRMIQLIRQHYQEDFNWESYRLNRVVVLSARIGDSQGLEDFLMREFFGDMPPHAR